jgi:SsrA-binding protein
MNTVIRNKRANYEYTVLDKYVAGIQLTGTEVKSLKLLKASITEAFCSLQNGEVFIRNMHIAEYANIKHTNHAPLRDRKLLLNKSEINKLSKAVNEKGLTIIPLNVLESDTGYLKVEIAVAKGKKSYDKRESIKERDLQRQQNKS